MPVRPRLARGRRERSRRRCEVEQPVAASALRAFQRIQVFAQAIEGGRILRIGLDEGHAFQKSFGGVVVNGTRRELAQALHEALAQLVVGLALAGHADDAEFFGQQVFGCQIVE